MYISGKKKYVTYEYVTYMNLHTFKMVYHTTL